MNMKIDFAKIRFGILAFILAVIISYYGQPLIHNNSQAISLITTVFSVLAGFLVAIIAITGDPALLPPGSWRAAEMERENILKRLTRHKWLFILYLVTLCFIFVSLLLQREFPQINIWFERVYLFFGVLAFTLSLRLPSVLTKIHQERIDCVIEHRRAQDKIKET
jgi:hypothetical protein